MMEIKNIKQYPEFQTEITKWLNSEWGSKTSLSYWSDWVEKSKDETSLFQTFVLVENGKPVATYGIMPCDLQSRQDLTPWVGNLFIPRKYRMHSMPYLFELFRHSEQIFRNLNMKRVYVYTPHNPKVFQKFGYRFIEFATDHKGGKISLLYKDII